MATATQNNTSDLLILSDDTSETITLDTPISNEEIITESANLISFDTEIDNSNDLEFVESKKESNKSLETDDIFDFGSLDDDAGEIDTELNTKTLDLSPEDTSTDLNGTKPEDKIESIITLDSETLDLGELSNISDIEINDNNNDLDLKEESVNEGLNLMEDELIETVIEEKAKEIFSLKDATLGFVSQLNDRKDQISNKIDSDEENISNRNSKITVLKLEIADFNKSIKELKGEDKEIDNKIGLVTGNTAANNIKATTSVKVHNVKRRKAANNVKITEKIEKIA